MAPKPKHGNETCTKRETWQLRMNIDQNNGSIHIYLKFYILGTIETPGGFRGRKWRRNHNAAMKHAQNVKLDNYV